MQEVSTPMLTALAMRSASSLATINRRPAWLYELYPRDYYPDPDGDFDPAEATALFAEVGGINWLGNDYRRQVLSRGSIGRYFSGQFNSVSVTLDNAELYMSAFVIANNVESLRLVIRYIDLDQSDTLTDSIVCFVGRLEKPRVLDEESCELSAVQELGSVNVEAPRRTYSATDPDGRSPADPRFHGFKFTPQTGLFQYPSTVTKRTLLFFVKKKTVLATGQWSSQDNINEGQALPAILGRVQIELTPILWADTGSLVKALWVAAGEKVSDIVNITNRTGGFLSQITKHLGDPGGTGTNAFPDPLFPSSGLLSDTAFIGAASNSDVDKIDAAPTVTAIVLCEIALPDGSNDFVLLGPSSNPAYLARHILTSSNYLNLDPRMVHPGDVIAAARYCDEFLLDQSNAEALVLGSAEAEDLKAGVFQRVSSSGVISPTDFHNALDGDFVHPLADFVRAPFLSVPPIDSDGGGGGGGVVGPQPLGATGSGFYLEILWNQALAAGPVSGFTVKVNGVVNIILDAVALARKVTLTLTTALSTSDTVVVSGAEFAVESAATATLSEAFDNLPVTVGGAVGPPPPGGGGGGAGEVELLSGVTLAGETVANAMWKYYFISVPEGVAQLQVVAVGSGDAALYTRAGQKPDASHFDCLAYNPSPETCTHTDPAAGLWWVGVLGHPGGASYSITATLTGDSGRGEQVPVAPSVNTVRRRFTFNTPVSDKVPAVDLLFKSLLPASRMYLLTGPDGRLRLKNEKPADSSYLFASASAGASTIKVTDVEAWRESLQGLALIGVGVVDSETKRITAAAYDPTTGNAVTLAVAATGSAGAVASGGTLAGGSGSVPASGTITLSGTGDVQHPSWHNLNGSLKKYPKGGMGRSDGNGYGSAGASTNRSIALGVDGYFEFRPSRGEFVAGLGYTNTPVSYTDVAYGFFMNQEDTVLGVIVDGVALGVLLPGGALGSITGVRGIGWAPGDVLRVVKTGTTVTFLKNGALVFTASSAVSATTYGVFVPNYAGALMTEAIMAPFPSGAIDAGDAITVTLNGVEVRYVVADTDSVESVAGMLAAFLTSAWQLRGSFRASWSSAAPTVVTINAKQGVLTLASALAHAHSALLENPSTAPALAEIAGSLDAGDYTFAFSYKSGSGETFVGPSATIRIAAGRGIEVTCPTFGSWPAGTALLGIYMSKSAGDPTLAFLTDNAGGVFNVNVVPDPSASAAPVANTAGHEVIRVMAAFTQENILRGKFKWPMSDLDKAINQVLIKYREATMDFAARELYVNDYLHQAQIQKTNRMEIDGQGIDNFNQAWRVANAALAKEREGNFFCEWDTDEAGIIFEEGDVVCCTDASGGFVNIPLRIESLSIGEDGNVSFRGRLYSTAMMSDDAGKHPIVIPTTLRYLNQPPPVATNVVLTLDEFFITGVVGDFDFGSFPAKQKAHIFIKGPAESEDEEPADSTYRLLDTVEPDDKQHGHFEIRAIVGGTYWVKIVTESVFGKKPLQGNPVAVADIRPQVVSDVTVATDAFGDFLIAFSGHPRLIEEPATYTVELWADQTRDNPANLKGILPVTPGTTHACLLNSVHLGREGVVGNPPDEEGGDEGDGAYAVFTSAASDKNNLISLPWDGDVGPLFGEPASGVTLEAIGSSFQRFDFSYQWIGIDRTLSGGGGVVGLQTRPDADPVSDTFDPVLADCIVSVEWTAGGLAGTVKETFKTFGVEIPGTSRDNIDPGFGSGSSIDDLVVSRNGPRYSFVLAGSEIRIVLNFGGQNQEVLARVATPTAGPPYPLRLTGNTSSKRVGSIGILNITRGGDQLSTIYSVRDQIAKQGTQQSRIYLRIYQDAKAPLPHGKYFNVVAPPL